jgi:hypothetical protein
MTVTYSLAVTGINANQNKVGITVRPSVTGNVQYLTLPDTAGLIGGQQNAMATGAQLLCQNPDGSQSWYVLDAERSTPTLPVLRKV